MGVARLLAKGWLTVCVFAAAHGVRQGLASGADPLAFLPALLVCFLLFAAMGLLFVAGYGASAGQGTPLLKRLKPLHFVPGFNELVFAAFVILSFIDQAVFAPAHLAGSVTDALESAVYFAVPGQRALVAALTPCAFDGGRIFASSFSWLLAVVFLGSALSRLKLAAGIVRLERVKRPEALGATTHAFVLGLAAVVAIQLLFVGSLYGFLRCSLLSGVPGALLIGLAPLLLSYLIVAALTSLLASGREK